MRFIFKFPDIGEGISEGKILEWHVEKGQTVKSGDPVVKMETDKVVADIPSPKDGVIVNIFGKIGEIIAVESPLVELEIQSHEEKTEKKVVEEKGFGVVGTLEEAGDSAYLPSSNEGLEIEKPSTKKIRKKILATPVARAMAKDLGININEIKGTGPSGRVTKKDIKAYFDSAKYKKSELIEEKPTEISEKEEYESISQIRKTIAKHMTISKHNAAHMTAFEEIEISNLANLISNQKENALKKGIKLTYLPFFIKAVVESLKSHKILNSQLDMENERIIYKNYFNIGIAVDTPEGLLVPVIKDADKLTIFELAKKIKDLASRAQERKLELNELKGGTFTITNYGSIAGTFGVPIINYPEVAILGTGRIREIPIIKNGKIKVGKMLPLSLSVDHRIIDGGEVARFLKNLMEKLSEPVSFLLG